MNIALKKTRVTERNPQFYRTRKALLFLPLLVIPLLILGFWNFHHQQRNQVSVQNQNRSLDTSLPGAKFDKHQKAGNKMSFYDLAKQDSARQQSANNNPLLQKFGFKSVTGSPANTGHNPALTTAYADPNVTRINQKLADINREISQPQTAALPAQAGNTVQDKAFSQQVNKLEVMMKAMNNNKGDDPQMQQLTKMLGQIQDIQHPELVKAETKPVVPVDDPFKAARAIIDGKQKVRQAGAVKLRLNDSLTVKGQVIPKGTLVYGTANITNQRLLIAIKNIRIGQSIIPVDLAVYYTDGMPGVPAPEAELGEAAGEGADNAMQSMEFLSMDQSLATQAAAGGIGAAKSLFSKKVKRIVVHLKDGDAVLLRNNQIH
jgi:hypothetical protein